MNSLEFNRSISFVRGRGAGIFNVTATLSFPLPNGEKPHRLTVEVRDIDAICDMGGHTFFFPGLLETVDTDTHLALVELLEAKGVTEEEIDGILDSFVSQFITRWNSGENMYLLGMEG